MNSGPLIDLLLEEGLLSDDQLSLIEPLISTGDGRLIETLAAKKLIDETIVASRIARRLALDFVDLASHTIPGDLEREVPIEIAEPHQLVPVGLRDERLTIAMSDPFDDAGREWVERTSTKSIHIAVSTATGVRRAIQKLYRRAPPPEWVLFPEHEEAYRAAVKHWGDHGSNQLFALAGERAVPTSSMVAEVNRLFLVEFTHQHVWPPSVFGLVDDDPMLLDRSIHDAFRVLRLSATPLHDIAAVIRTIHTISSCDPFDEESWQRSASWHGVTAGPPRFDGRWLEICYEDPNSRTICRAEVDAHTYEVTMETLGEARLRVIRGRPYVDEHGRMNVPELEVEAAASAISAIADEWRECAAYEYASVASFARASLELMSAGAPAELVKRTHEAAADEVTHAELCYRLAERLDGRRARPGALAALPARGSDLADLAVHTFREGSIAEAIAVREAEVALEHATDPEVRQILETIIDDEDRHRALADEIVAWAIQTGGAHVTGAIRRAIEELLGEAEAEPEGSSVPNERWAFGLLDGAQRSSIAASVIRSVCARWV